MPARLTRPRVGLPPTTPQALDGETIEPSVSVPTARGAKPADRPAAEPELDPDGLRSSAYGFAVWPPSVDQPLVERVDRKFAHSDRFALARMTAPAARSRETMNASGGLAPSSAGEPAVAGSPATWTLSLIRTGIPSRGPRGRPARQAASHAAAWSRASGLTAITARSAGFTSEMRSMQCLASAVAVRLDEAIAWRSPATEHDAMSLAPGISLLGPDELWKSGMRAG